MLKGDFLSTKQIEDAWVKVVDRTNIDIESTLKDYEERCEEG